MKTLIFFLAGLFFLTSPIVGKTTILSNNSPVWFKSQCTADKEIKMMLSENGKNEDDPATDDGEDLRDGDSDSNSNDDSDKDNG
jgi:hypothetical protein